MEKIIGCWPVQINGNKFATSQILEKSVEVVKGRILVVELKSLPNHESIDCFYHKSNMLACERAIGASLAPSRCRTQIWLKKCLPAGGGLRLALPPAGVGKPLIHVLLRPQYHMFKISCTNSIFYLLYTWKSIG